MVRSAGHKIVTGLTVARVPTHIPTHLWSLVDVGRITGSPGHFYSPDTVAIYQTDIWWILGHQYYSYHSTAQVKFQKVSSVMRRHAIRGTPPHPTPTHPSAVNRIIFHMFIFIRAGHRHSVYHLP